MDRKEFNDFKTEFSKVNNLITGLRDYRLDWQDGYHDLERKFVAEFNRDHYSDHERAILIYGSKETDTRRPNQYLTEDEEKLIMTIIQWLGTPVGQSFLNKCGFYKSEAGGRA